MQQQQPQPRSSDPAAGISIPPTLVTPAPRTHDAVSVADELLVAVLLPVCVLDSVAVAVSLDVCETVWLSLIVAELDEEGSDVAVPVRLAETPFVREAVPVGERVGVLLGLAVRVALVVAVSVADKLLEAVMLADAPGESVFVGVVVVEPVSLGVPLGDAVPVALQRGASVGGERMGGRRGRRVRRDGWKDWQCATSSAGRRRTAAR